MIRMRVIALVAALAVCGCSYMRHPSETTLWGQPDGTMVLGLEARGEVINVFLKNSSAHPQRIIAKGFTLTFEPAGGGAEPIQIVDATNIPLDRDETFEELKPGESLATPMSLKRLHPGSYAVSAAYHPQAAGTWWTGSLTAGPITFVKP
jgi:hypothetical protein